MNWNNLKNNKCPKCKGSLIHNARAVRCEYNDFTANSQCDFTCSVRKFNQLVNELYKPKAKRVMMDDENLEDLNNL